MDADFSELLELAQDLENAPDAADPFIRKAVEITARKVKDAARDKVQARKHFGQAARTINYDLLDEPGVRGLDAEVGYNKHWRSARLGNLIEFGAPGSSNRLAPGSELRRSLAENQDDFVEGLSKALADGLKASGL